MYWFKSLRGIAPAILENDPSATWMGVNELRQVVSRVVNDGPTGLAAAVLADL